MTSISLFLGYPLVMSHPLFHEDTKHCYQSLKPFEPGGELEIISIIGIV